MSEKTPVGAADCTMPFPQLVFGRPQTLLAPTPFHFGTVTFLLYPAAPLGYLSGNIPVRNA